MVEDGICRPSSSQWASPLHLVAKKSQEWRPCGDYRRLNAITIPDRYPIANVEDFTYNLENKKVFTTIDLVRAYHQVPVAEEDVAKTAVITPFGLFEFIYMPFGLRNAAQTFQRYIDIVLRGLDFCFGYLDDILVASNSLEQHKQHLEVLFKRLSEYGIKINPSKCHFAKESTIFGLYGQQRRDSTFVHESRCDTKRETPRNYYGASKVFGTSKFLSSLHEECS